MFRSSKLALAALVVALGVAIALPVSASAIGASPVWVERMLDTSANIIDVDMVDADTIFALDANGRVFRTLNGGASWTAVRSPLALGGLKLNDIEFWDADHGWAVGLQTFIFQPGDPPSYTSAVFRTTDGGDSWVRADTGSATEELTAVAASGASYAWAVGKDGRAFEGNGDTWTSRSAAEPSKDYNDVVIRTGFVLGFVDIVAVGDSGVITHYDGNFLTGDFTPYARTSGTTSSLKSVAANSVDSFIAVGDDSTFVESVDGAETWNDRSSATANWQSVCTVGDDANRAVAVGSQGQVRQFVLVEDVGYLEGELGGPIAGAVNLLSVSMASLDDGRIGGLEGTLYQRGTASTDRVAGSNRYATAIEMSRSTFPDGACETVVLATGLNFPDALSASGLAGSYESPLLLEGATLSNAVKNELTRLGADTVVLVGGEAAVPKAVADALTSAGFTVDRIAGSNRYDTAEKVARRVASLEGTSFSKSAFVAVGTGFADALAVSPFAYSQRMPVLLTPTASLPPDTISALQDLDVESAVVAGGSAVVSDAAKDQISAITIGNGGAAADRWAGTDRYSTAVQVVANGVSAGWATHAYLGVATGLDYPDALGGGAVCGENGGVLLLTTKDALPNSVAAYIDLKKNEILDAVVFGGTAVVSDNVRNQLNNIIP